MFANNKFVPFSEWLPDERRGRGPLAPPKAAPGIGIANDLGLVLEEVGSDIKNWLKFYIINVRPLL